MKFHIISLIISTLLFHGCGSDSSQGSTATTSGASTPSSLPAGLSIAVNPTITFTSSLVNGATVSVTYDNPTGFSTYPVYTGPVDVTMSTSGTAITLSFDFSNVFTIPPTLEIVLDGFVDRGGDGHTDEFTVTSTIDGAVQPAVNGQFVGNTKPVNENISEANRVDITGTPTEDEFQKYLVGFAIHANDNSDNYFLLFKNQTDVVFIDGGDLGTGSYTYNYNSGNPTLILDIEGGDGDKWVSTVNLSFNGFYQGTWQETSHVFNGVNDTNLDSGPFTIFAGTKIDDLIGLLD